MAPKASTIRYASILQAGGVPEIYLPLADPKEDPRFMRAVQEGRVVSVKQEPTGTQKDFGIIGFRPEKYVTYLLFPKSLDKFKGKRVVGIKYDSLQQSKVSTAPVKAGQKKAKPKAEVSAPRQSEPKEFVATIRLIATQEISTTVNALNEKEARAKALASTQSIRDWASASIESRLVRIKKRIKNEL